MNGEYTYYIQLIGAALLGSFIGELSRTSKKPPDEVSFFLFVAAFLGSSLLAIIAALAYYWTSSDRQWAFLLAGFAGYLDEKYVLKLIKGLMRMAVDEKEEED